MTNQMTTLPEAPASVNVRVKSPKGFTYQFTLRNHEMKTVISNLTALERYFIDHGWSPAEGRAGSVPSGTNGDAPSCPTHGRAMKQSQHGGWFCPAKVADDDGTGKPIYCKQKVK